MKKLLKKIQQVNNKGLNAFLTLTSEIFNKPSSFVMTGIEDNTELQMGNKNIEKGAYIEIKLFGNTNKSVCNVFTKKISEFLEKFYGINPQFVYITYFPVDLWGWNGQMF